MRIGSVTCDLTQEEALRLLEYEPESGVLRFRVGRSNVRAGAVAGSVNAHGYRQLKVANKDYLAHRVIWLMVHGRWPADQIDHIDGDRLNNRLDNLREATHAENGRNLRMRATNTSGVTGVYWSKRSKRWVAQIRDGGRQRYIGQFCDMDAAIAARRAAEKVLFGEFSPIDSLREVERCQV